MKTTVMAGMMMALAATATAQVMVHEPDTKAAKEQHLQILTEKTAATGAFVSVETKPVPGAPYNAEAITETIQVLADGNRIVRRTTARIYRDGSGRTRRETLGAEGQVTSVVISDPARGTSVVFDPVSNTAHRSSTVTYVVTADGRVDGTASSSGTAFYVVSDTKGEAESKTQPHAEQKTAPPAVVTAHASGTAGGAVTSVGPVTWVTKHDSVFEAAPTREDLGQQVIEGVPARGTRTTSVIAAGTIGNELPIRVISEEWTSIDLKVLVLTKHVDPRAGETTYRLTGITRGEPSPSLFELPAGVAVK